MPITVDLSTYDAWHSLSAGTHTVQVMARSSSKGHSFKSKALSFNVVKLAAPTITQATGRINWSAVTNAVSYKVYKGSSILATITALTYSVTEPGRYKVVAVSPTAQTAHLEQQSETQIQAFYVDSEESNSVLFTRLAAPTLAKSGGSTLKWNAVQNALGYAVYRGTTIVATIFSTTTKEYTATRDGSYTVVAFNTAVPRYLPSNASNAITVDSSAYQYTRIDNKIRLIKAPYTRTGTKVRIT